MKPNAQNAIHILKEIRGHLGPAHVAFWALPNAVLTLSGARAYCDGVFWHEDDKGMLDAWDKEIIEAVAVIKAHFAVVTAETGVQEVRKGERYASYELVFETGLQYVLSQTQLAEGDIMQRLKLLPTTPELIDALCKDLRERPDFTSYSDDTIHHIAFGILVGYPDKAILESAGKWEADDPFAERLVDADIRGAGYYMCPQPVYSYPRHLMNDPDITRHEQLWSKILCDYYTSDFHKSLEADKQFQQKTKQLGSCR